MEINNFVSDLLVFPKSMARSHQRPTGMWGKTTATAQTQRGVGFCHQEKDFVSLMDAFSNLTAQPKKGKQASFREGGRDLRIPV